MKRIILAVIATLSLLTATGQQMQYRDDYLLPHYMATGCSDFEKEHVFGYGNGYALGYAQPFFIDTTVAVKGIAAFMYIQQPITRNYGYPLYLQIRDSTLTHVLAQIRYDTLTTKQIPGGMVHEWFIEELFEHSIPIQDSRFYIVATFPPELLGLSYVAFNSTIYMHDSNCYDGNFPVLIQGNKNREWLPANIFDSLRTLEIGNLVSEDYWKRMPYELHVFPILDNIDTNGTDTNTNKLTKISQSQLEKYTYLYPNPATNEITLASSVVLTKVELFNAAGQKVYEQEIKANSVNINISSFAKGTYIAKLHTRQGVVSKKFIVK